jgi:hypothetical protein
LPTTIEALTIVTVGRSIGSVRSSIDVAIAIGGGLGFARGAHFGVCWRVVELQKEKLEAKYLLGVEGGRDARICIH